MSTIADIDADLSKFSIEDWEASDTLHVISRLVEVTNPWDMSFLLDTENVSVIVNNDSSIVQSSSHLMPFENRRYNNHVVLFGQLAENLSALSLNGLCELHPRVSFTSTHKERSVPDLLQAKNVGLFGSSSMNHLNDPINDGLLLNIDRFGCGLYNLILYGTDEHPSRLPKLFLLGWYRIFF
jgi:hypothetical protein